MIHKDTLIYDIETKTFGKPDADKDQFKVFGCYSYKTEKYYYLTKSADIQKIINDHKYFVGFNNVKYDNPILIREGIDFKYKIIVDLMDIFIKRAGGMKIKKGMLGDLLMKYSLDFITKTLGLVDEESGKKDIDYSIFNKNVWSADERKEIIEYLKRDVEVTKKLYEWIEDYFADFVNYVDDKDINNKNYLKCSISAFAYKSICRELGWSEDYDDRTEGEKYGGGYVSYPKDESNVGDIYCIDYSSLYPHAIMQCNFCSPVTKGWDGNGKFKVDGTYNDKEMGKVESLMKKWYNDRLVYKEDNDRREYTLKILLNSTYGTVGSSVFKRMYSRVAANDVTQICRQWTMLARERFREAGYINLYSDTDSIFLLDPFKDKNKMLKIKDMVIQEIKDNVPFPLDTFDMTVDDEITHLFFFKGLSKEEKVDEYMDEDDYKNKPLGLMKKNYLYITKEGDVIYKNLGVKKKSTSLLTRKIFNEYLIPKIKEEKKVKFARTYFKNLILELLEKDISLAVMRKNVDHHRNYKSSSSLSAQISAKYGAGIHFLIPNNKSVGVGKKKKFCTLEEFKERSFKIEHIDLDNVWKELDYFIKPVVTAKLFDFE